MTEPKGTKRRWITWAGISRVVRLPLAYGGALALLLGFAYRFPVRAFNTQIKPGLGGALIAVGAVLVLLFAAIEIANRYQLRTASVDGEGHATLAPEPFTTAIDLGAHIRLLTSAQSHFSSIRETITPFAGHYLHQFSLTARLPRSTLEDGGTETFFIPILLHARGEIITDLAASDANDERLVVLSEGENRGLANHLLQSSAQVLLKLPAAAQGELSPLETICGYIARDWPLGGSLEAEGYDPREEPEFKDAMSELARCEMAPAFPSPESWDRERERFLRLCRVLVESQPVFVAVQAVAGSAFIVQFQYRRWQNNVARGFKNWVRYGTGLLPYRHQIPIQQAHRTGSYEVRFNAPANQYVYESRVISDRTAEMIAVSGTDGWGALSYATATLRPVEPSRSRFARSIVQFAVDIRERPFGLIGIVAILALAQAGLIWVLGIFHPTFFPAGASPGTNCTRAVAALAKAKVTVLKGGTIECNSGGSTADATTILLALPALVAGWVGAQFTSDRMQWTSIATLWGLLLAGLISIGSTTLAVWKLIGRPLDDDLIGVQHPAWAFFMLASALLALDLSTRAVTRSIRFARRMARSGLVERYTI